MFDHSIRMATGADAGAVCAIYAPYVRETVISFEYEAPDEAEMLRRMENVLTMYPWLITERGGVAAGYAYASRFHPRAAFQWTVETSVYIAPWAHRQGLARALYEELFRVLRAQGVCNAVAGITLPNPPSVGFHEAMGFVSVREHPHVGFKHGGWYAVGYWQREVQALPSDPVAPLPVGALRDLADFSSLFMGA